MKLSGTILLALSILLPAFACAQPLEIVIQSGHLEEIRDVAYSPDGCHIATAGVDNRVKLWNETTGHEIRSFRGAHSPHRSVVFVDGGQSLLIGVEQGPVTQWRVSDGSRVREFPVDSSSSIAVAEEAGVMAVTGGDQSTRNRTITLLNLDSGAEIQTYEWTGRGNPDAAHLSEDDIELPHEPNRVALSRDGRYFATTGDEGRTALWESGNAVPLRFYTQGPLLEDDTKFWTTMSRPNHAAVAFSPTLDLLAGAFGTVVYVWPINVERPAVTLEGNESSVTFITFSPDGSLVAIGNRLGEVIIWDITTGESLTKFQAHASAVNAISFRPKGEGVQCTANLPASTGPLAGRILVTSGSDQRARIWSLDSSRIIRSLSPKVLPLNGLSFNADGTKLAIASAAVPNGTAKIWDLTSGFDVTSFPVLEGGVNSIAFSNDGNLIATAGELSGTIIWDAALMKPVGVVEPPERPRWRDMLDDAIGLLILSSERGTAVIGNSALSEALNTLGFQANSGARALAFGPNDQFLALGGSEDLQLWDIETGTLLDTEFGEDGMDEIAFTPDGSTLVSAGGRSVSMDAASGERLEIFARAAVGRRYPVSLSIHPNGRDVAFGHRRNPGMIDVREIESRDSLHEFETGGTEIHSIDFNADGTILVAGDAGGLLHVYSYGPEVTLIRTIEAHTDTVFDMEFSPDGRMLASASADGTVVLSDTGTWEEIVRFVSIGSDDFVMLTPDNYYAASTNGNHGIVFRQGTSLYPFEQFDLQLNRPDIVFERLGTVSDTLVSGYRDAYFKRLARMGVESVEALADTSLPTARIEDLPRRLTVADPNLEFTLVAEDAEFPLSTLHVWVNDVPLYGSSGYPVSDPVRNVRLPVNLELSAGRNKIQVSAVNSRGNESFRTTIETIYEPAAPVMPDLYVVAIGVSDYGDPAINLEYPEKDAIDLLDSFSRQQRFANIHEIPLLGASASRETILSVKRTLQQTRVDDEVVLFVAGHGLLDAELNYYFATPDIDFATPADRGVSFEELESLLDGIPARRKLLLMDTCYSGEVDTSAIDESTADDSGSFDSVPEQMAVAEGVSVRSIRGVTPRQPQRSLEETDAFDLMQELFANLGRGSGSVVIAASGGDEFAYEGSGTRNGVFTHSVIEAFSSTSPESHLRLSEFRDYVVKRVRTLTGGQQTPSVRRVNLDLDYAVYSVATPELTDVPPIESQDFGALLIQGAEQMLSGN